ncbi:MAG: ribosome biogenesis GTP-binding protein YihA/YsxC [Firmicutes bacterium]|nr:ribosome biogenesis GTP-binding protein YihA/YsxC [Bacillota bacterium]
MQDAQTFKIKSASFITSIADMTAYQAAAANLPAPEICVTGRSNVGKSSFINLLANQKKLAKTSQTPGRTRLLNLFDFNAGLFTLVDLPGYGYAAASKSEIERFSKLTESYFDTTQKLAHAFALVDIRHAPTQQDKQMVQYLYTKGISFTVIATKADKISKSQLPKHLQTLASGLSLGKDNILAVSAQTAFGKDAVLARLQQILHN